MSTEHIGRRTVALFFLTSLANVGGVVLFAAPLTETTGRERPSHASTSPPLGSCRLPVEAALAAVDLRLEGKPDPSAPARF